MVLGQVDEPLQVVELAGEGLHVEVLEVLEPDLVSEHLDVVAALGALWLPRVVGVDDVDVVVVDHRAARAHLVRLRLGAEHAVQQLVQAWWLGNFIHGR